MSEDMGPAIDAFVKAQNAHDSEALIKCFTRDAVVHDEGEDYRGTTAIRRWADGVIEKYRLSAEVQEVVNRGNESEVTALVSGTFPGSPTQITWIFSLRDGKIAEFRS